MNKNHNYNDPKLAKFLLKERNDQGPIKFQKYLQALYFWSCHYSCIS